jgi:hypothetical protein
MRTALGIYCINDNITNDDINNAFKTYYYMSNLYFIHGTPTNINSGLK